MVLSTQTNAVASPGAGQHARSPPRPVAHAGHGHIVQPGAGVYARQLPRTQTEPRSHARRQSPQCSGLVIVSTHPPTQSRSPFPHIIAAWHVPWTQICPAVHAVPTAPQFRPSLCRSTQAPLAVAVSPGRQAHVPFAHTWSARH
jgi:hypothetical protein